jgi:hypothetical protein
MPILDKLPANNININVNSDIDASNASQTERLTKGGCGVNAVHTYMCCT